jgi:ADP-ribose pyrophosphatase YjhB (NUDIX family)
MVKITSSDKIIYLISDYSIFKPESGFILVSVSSATEVENSYQTLLRNKEINTIYFFNSDEAFLLSAFKSMFKLVEAAGGLVRNPENKFLFIFRNGKWDLPKGKIEKGEAVKKAAMREVEEECGVSGLKIIKELETTYHTYKMDGKNILKPTYWFEMQTADDSRLIPQAEEGITEVRWIKKTDFELVKENTYGSILDIIAGV